jgi:hypothetical protein
LKLESVEAMLEAIDQSLEIMTSATKRVRTPTGTSEQPDWPTRLKAARLVIAATIAIVPEFAGADKLKPDRRALRIAP